MNKLRKENKAILKLVGMSRVKVCLIMSLILKCGSMEPFYDQKFQFCCPRVTIMAVNLLHLRNRVVFGFVTVGFITVGRKPYWWARSPLYSCFHTKMMRPTIPPRCHGTVSSQQARISVVQCTCLLCSRDGPRGRRRRGGLAAAHALAPARRAPAPRRLQLPPPDHAGERHIPPNLLLDLVANLTGILGNFFNHPKIVSIRN